MKIKYDHWIPKKLKVNGIAMFGYALFADKKEDVGLVLINHERIHVDQMKRDGYIMFYVRYFYEYFKYRRMGHDHYNAYRRISYEQEAWLNQKNLYYVVQK
jgi:hypothetical protein